MILQKEENKGVELTGDGGEIRRQKLEGRNERSERGREGRSR
jgi:hypothetical protein